MLSFEERIALLDKALSKETPETLYTKLTNYTEENKMKDTIKKEGELSLTMNINISDEDSVQGLVENLKAEGKIKTESSNVSTHRYKILDVSSTIPKERTKVYSNKAGSAVVHYKSGETFHISRLSTLDVFQTEDAVIIDVTRTYIKDGLLFQERVGIPEDKFLKIVWKAPKDLMSDTYGEMLSDEITIEYNSACGLFQYSLNMLSGGFDFT